MEQFTYHLHKLCGIEIKNAIETLESILAQSEADIEPEASIVSELSSIRSRVFSCHIYMAYYMNNLSLYSVGCMLLITSLC